MGGTTPRAANSIIRFWYRATSVTYILDNAASQLSSRNPVPTQSGSAVQIHALLLALERADWPGFRSLVLGSI